jgi:2-phosphoglycolate phosphatase
MTMTTIKAVLFDLDGTLLDTAHDLGLALNQLLEEQKLPMLPLDIIRPAAGSGCKGLLKLGMNIDTTDACYPSLSEKLLRFYQDNIINTTQFFPGIEDTLRYIEKNNMPWGIVTNKPARYTDQLIMHLELAKRVGCVISGDSLQNRKPHPEPILHACKLLSVEPKDCLYIGDSAIDIEASKAAGNLSLAALYGYIPAEENPLTWGANGYIKHPLEIIDWIETRNADL